MKRSILAILAIALSMHASAKALGTEWGLTAGVSYNKMSLKSAAAGLSLSPDITYNAGLHASLVILGVAIQPEINYGYTKLRVHTPTQSVSTPAIVKAHELEVPVLLSLRFLPVIRFNVGPVFNIMSKANYQHNNENMLFGPVHPSMGYAVGFSLCIFKKLLIDARYTGYFKTTVNEINLGSTDPYTFNIRACSGGIKIGYLF